MLALPNGIGRSLGPMLVSIAPLRLSGNVWFVSSVDGTDGAGDAGKDAEAPLATLGQAVTNSSDNDIIVLSDDHDETLTGALTISKKLTICGSAIQAGVPTSKLTLNAAAGNLLTITGTNVELSGIYIAENDQTNASARIAVSGTQFAMHACYVPCGATDTGAAVSLASGADYAYFHSTTFVSTATLIASRPHSAILTTAAISDLYLDGLILDGGTVGFSNIWALDASTAAVTRLHLPPWGSGVSLLRGADMRFHSSSTGKLSVPTASGSARVDW